MTDAERYLEIVPSILPWPVGTFGLLDKEIGKFGGFVVETTVGPECCDDHIALCILRNAVREWLEARGIIVVRFRATGEYTFTGCSEHYSSYDDALIAAVKAAHEEDHGCPGNL